MSAEATLRSRNTALARQHLAGTRSFGMPELGLIANSAIALGVFLGGFVSFEPAPYDAYLPFLFFAWVMFGMRIPRSIAPLLFLFTAFCAGGILASFQIADREASLVSASLAATRERSDAYIYVAITYFLALTSVFFACVIAADMGRLRMIFRAYVVAAVTTSLLGIIGYFGMPGFAMFTRYDRAMGAFQDPNVFGPFLVAPIIYLLYGLLNRSSALMALRAGAMFFLMLGVFLSFSRAAWGLTVISSMLFLLLLIINEQRSKIRLKYTVLGIAGVLAVVVMLMIASQFEAISDILKQRLILVQEYDGGNGGRFERHYLGFLLALETPLGVGPLEFGHIIGEDTHNILLKALMDYGWLGFLAWIAMTAWTLIGAFKMLFRPRPWQPYLQIAYVLFLGHFLVGMVIDTDHWRHQFLIIGLIWGSMALEAQWQNRMKPSLLTQLSKANP